MYVVNSVKTPQWPENNCILKVTAMIFFLLTLKKYIPPDTMNKFHTEILICTVSNVFPEKTPVNTTVWQYNSNYPAMKTCFLLFPNWHSNKYNYLLS